MATKPTVNEMRGFGRSSQSTIEYMAAYYKGIAESAIRRSVADREFARDLNKFEAKDQLNEAQLEADRSNDQATDLCKVVVVYKKEAVLYGELEVLCERYNSLRTKVQTEIEEMSKTETREEMNKLYVEIYSKYSQKTNPLSIYLNPWPCVPLRDLQPTNYVAVEEAQLTVPEGKFVTDKPNITAIKVEHADFTAKYYEKISKIATTRAGLERKFVNGVKTYGVSEENLALLDRRASTAEQDAVELELLAKKSATKATKLALAWRKSLLTMNSEATTTEFTMQLDKAAAGASRDSTTANDEILTRVDDVTLIRVEPVEPDARTTADETNFAAATLKKSEYEEAETAKDKTSNTIKDDIAVVSTKGMEGAETIQKNETKEVSTARTATSHVNHIHKPSLASTDASKDSEPRTKRDKGVEIEVEPKKETKNAQGDDSSATAKADSLKGTESLLVEILPHSSNNVASRALPFAPGIEEVEETTTGVAARNQEPVAYFVKANKINGTGTCCVIL